MNRTVPTPGQYAWSSSVGFTEFALGNFAVEAGSSVFVFQSDGNLVLYNAAGRATWQSRTYGRGAAKLSFQSDGNIVIYRANSTPLWSSGSGYGSRPGSWVLYLTAVETPAMVSVLNSNTAGTTYWRIP